MGPPLTSSALPPRSRSTHENISLSFSPPATDPPAFTNIFVAARPTSATLRGEAVAIIESALLVDIEGNQRNESIDCSLGCGIVPRNRVRPLVGTDCFIKDRNQLTLPRRRDRRGLSRKVSTVFRIIHQLSS